MAYRITRRHEIHCGHRVTGKARQRLAIEIDFNGLAAVDAAAARGAKFARVVGAHACTPLPFAGPL